jgi:hypothetical protein
MKTQDYWRADAQSESENSNQIASLKKIEIKKRFVKTTGGRAFSGGA